MVRKSDSPHPGLNTIVLVRPVRNDDGMRLVSPGGVFSAPTSFIPG